MGAEAKTILVIDDDEDILLFLSDLLESDEYIPLTASGAREGLELARSKQPDMILLDIMMPEMDGHEVCLALRADKATQNIPVIMVTAKNDIRDVGQSLNAGAKGFIAKPFDSEHLLKFVGAKLLGDKEGFYAKHDNEETSLPLGVKLASNLMTVFLDIIEPQTERSRLSEACEAGELAVVKMSQLDRGQGRVETTALIECAQAECFGSLVNMLTQMDEVELLGCRVYEEEME